MNPLLPYTVLPFGSQNQFQVGICMPANPTTMSVAPMPPNMMSQQCMPRFTITPRHSHDGSVLANHKSTSEQIRAAILKTQSCCEAMQAAAAAQETFEACGLLPHEVKHITSSASLNSQTCLREQAALKQILLTRLQEEYTKASGNSLRETLWAEIVQLKRELQPEQTSAASSITCSTAASLKAMKRIELPR